MSPATLWPGRLAECLDEPPTPACLTSCPFRLVCPTHVQLGVQDHFVSGKWKVPADCGYHGRVRNLLWGEYGIAPPETAEELRDAMQEREALREADG